MKARVALALATVCLMAIACASRPTPGSTRSAPTTSTSVRERVRIDPAVYAFDERLGYSHEAILVRGSFDPAAGVAALDRVAARFLLVDETGVEHDSDAGFPPLGPDGNELYTPNYVGDPVIRPGGVELYVDCKAAIEPGMRETFLRILREELAVLGDVTVLNVT